jgi:hypothetical protein
VSAFRGRLERNAQEDRDFFLNLNDELGLLQPRGELGSKKWTPSLYDLRSGGV